MADFTKISVDELVSLIKEHKEGKKQDKPAVVWFENVEGDLVKYGDHGDYMGFAVGISKDDDQIALNLDTGSPLTDHVYVYDGNVTRKITEKERREFIVTSAIKPTTRVYLHSSFTTYMGKNGLDSVEYAKMVHDNLRLPVFLLFPAYWKEKLDVDFSGYQQYLCTDTLENVKQRWMERAAEKTPEGYQRVDNFFLDFIKVAPNEIVSHEFTPENRDMIQVTYAKWEELSYQLQRIIRSLLKINIAKGDKDKLEEINARVFPDGNLYFDALSPLLEDITEEQWEEWCEDNNFDIGINDYFAEAADRLSAVKAMIACNSGRFPGNVSEALLKYHGVIQ